MTGAPNWSRPTVLRPGGLTLGQSGFLLGVVDDTILVSEFFFFFLDCVVDDDQSRAL